MAVGVIWGTTEACVTIIQASLYVVYFSFFFDHIVYFALCISYAISFDVNTSLQKMFSRWWVCSKFNLLYHSGSTSWIQLHVSVGHYQEKSDSNHTGYTTERLLWFGTFFTKYIPYIYCDFPVELRNHDLSYRIPF